MITIKRITITVVLIITIVNLFAQTDSLEVLQVADTNFIVGECDRSDLQKGEFGDYFFEEYRNYKADRELSESIKNKIFNCSITIVLATWCHDSQLQVPRFMKILDNIDYNTNYLKIICVDKEKKAGDIDISMLDIKKVPTFIFYKEDKEVGRIIETPSETLEIDTFNILEK